MCNIVCEKGGRTMATNLAIDDKLLHEALEISGLKTKKDTVNLALKEFVDRHKQLEILSIFGKMDPDPDYDYKKGRSR
jgi:Arc/MetJ family transcription regulator